MSMWQTYETASSTIDLTLLNLHDLLLRNIDLKIINNFNVQLWNNHHANLHIFHKIRQIYVVCTNSSLFQDFVKIKNGTVYYHKLSIFSPNEYIFFYCFYKVSERFSHLPELTFFYCCFSILKGASGGNWKENQWHVHNQDDNSYIL